MNSTMISEKQIRDFCGMMVRDFGIHLDEKSDMLPVYMVSFMAAKMAEKTTHEACESMKKIAGTFEVETKKTLYESNERMAQTVEKFEKETASKLSKMKTKRIYFADSKQAFYYSFGSWGLPLLVAVLLSVSAYLYIKHEQKGSKAILEQFAKRAKLEDKFTDSSIIQVMRLYPVGDISKAVEGTHYVYNKDCNCIEVPISYQLK